MSNQPLTPLSPLPTPTATSTISSSILDFSPSLSNSSSSSIISRQSSCRSTTSVIAVPFKQPVRGPLAGNQKIKSTATGVGGGGGGGGGGANPYFSAAPMRRKGSNGANGGNSYPSSLLNGNGNGVSANASASANGLDSFTFGKTYPTPSTSTNGDEGTRKVERKEEQEENEEDIMERTRDSVILDERPIIPRAGSSTLGNQPAIKLIPTGSTIGEGGTGAEELNAMIIRKTPSDFKFGEVLGEGSYSTVCLSSSSSYQSSSHKHSNLNYRRSH